MRLVFQNFLLICCKKLPRNLTRLDQKLPELFSATYKVHRSSSSSVTNYSNQASKIELEDLLQTKKLFKSSLKERKRENGNDSKFLDNRRSTVFDPFSALDSWDPFRVFFNFPSASSLIPRENSAFVNARVDWKETPEGHVFKAELPGLKKEEVKVEVEEGRVLQINGERNAEKEDKNDTWHRVERSSGKFVRRFRLPENAKMEGVKASMENGVLTVTVPKAEVKKPEIKGNFLLLSISIMFLSRGK